MAKCNCPDPIIAVGDTESRVKAKVKKPRTKRKLSPSKKYGEGDYCVFSKTEKKVRCFKTEQSANNVARGFGRGYTVRRSATKH